MNEVVKKEIAAELNYVKRVSKEGLYGTSVSILNELQRRISRDNINFSIFEDLLSFEIFSDAGEKVGSCCSDCCDDNGVCCYVGCGIGCCLLSGWAVPKFFPQYECCGEVAGETSSCLCNTGKNILGVCWETCCCCC